MTNPNEEQLWGFHLNETIYSLLECKTTAYGSEYREKVIP